MERILLSTLLIFYLSGFLRGEIGFQNHHTLKHILLSTQTTSSHTFKLFQLVSECVPRYTWVILAHFGVFCICVIFVHSYILHTFHFIYYTQ